MADFAHLADDWLFVAEAIKQALSSSNSKAGVRMGACFFRGFLTR